MNVNKKKDAESSTNNPGGKSKAQLRAERRELQEQQRAAKAAKGEQKKTPCPTSKALQAVVKGAVTNVKAEVESDQLRAELRELQEQQRAAKCEPKKSPCATSKAPQTVVKAAVTNAKADVESVAVSTPTSIVTVVTRPRNPSECSGSGNALRRAPADIRQDDPQTRKKELKKLEKQHVPQRATYEIFEKSAFFSHLTQYRLDFSFTQNLPFNANTSVHPSFIKLGLQLMHGQIVGANSRCVAFVAALMKLVRDYECPPSKVFLREFESAALSPNLRFLAQCRPHAVTVRNAVAYVKRLLNESYSPDMPTTFVKEQLDSNMRQFVRERIQLADRAIADSALEKIHDGDVILTYANSSVVGHVLCNAHLKGRRFRVLILDARPRWEGRQLLCRLRNQGLTCEYAHLNSAAQLMPRVTCCLLGAAAIMANGQVLSRVGQGQVACVAAAFRRPLLICCETYKFWDRVQCDSLVFNELSDPNRLYVAKEMKQSDVCRLDLEYDVTPADLVSAVVTELAILPCSSAPVVLRVRNQEVAA